MTENVKTRQNAYFKMALKARTLLSTMYILLDHFNACGLSRNNFFCRKQRGRRGGGGEF